jgi:cell division protein FtsB
MKETVQLTPEQEKARKRRNLWIALSLAAFMVLVFVITLARLKAGVLDRPL